jgi:hypothetical protein
VIPTSADFEDLLETFDGYGVRALVIGGLAFTFHARPRYTKDLDIWVDPEPDNVAAANRALAAFGSPFLLDPDRPDLILELPVAPNRIDLIRQPGPLPFGEAWARRIPGRFGRAPAHWIALEDLITLKSAIDDPRHQEDVRVLHKVLELRKK